MFRITDLKSQISNPKSAHRFAWQGLTLDLPRSWNPIRLEGDYRAGHALFADMDHPRLGLRWETPRSRNANAVLQRAARRELGAERADKPKSVKGGLLFPEPEPPGRDVFFEWSIASRRLVQFTYHAKRRDHVLADQILPSLTDTALADSTNWCIFDLACTMPAGFRLLSHHLNAGDLALTFARKRQRLTVRQIALASIALQRLPLHRWLAQQVRAQHKYYRPIGNLSESEFPSPGGHRSMTRHATRRRRFLLARWLSPRLITTAYHDEPRDRIVIIQATDQHLLDEVARTVGG